MMKRYLQYLTVALIALFLLAPGKAQAVSFHEVPWGMVKVDLNLDGEIDLVVHAWPEDDLSMKNAQIQFLIFDTQSEDGLRSVSIEGQDNPYFLLPAQEEGACKSYDFALMATGKTRDTRRFDMIHMQKSDEVDAENNGKVTFQHYRLEKNLEEAAISGGNPYIYVKAGEFTPPEVYCDVKVAFEENLEVIGETFEDEDPQLKEKKADDTPG